MHQHSFDTGGAQCDVVRTASYAYNTQRGIIMSLNFISCVSINLKIFYNSTEFTFVPRLISQQHFRTISRSNTLELYTTPWWSRKNNHAQTILFCLHLSIHGSLLRSPLDQFPVFLFTDFLYRVFTYSYDVCVYGNCCGFFLISVFFIIVCNGKHVHLYAYRYMHGQNFQ